MQEFSSISVSTYEPDGLVGQLNEHAAAGWEVVAIVPTGSTVTAYLSRAASDDAGAVAETAASEPAAGETTPAAAGAAAVGAVAATAAASEPAPHAAATPATSEPALPGAAATAEPTPAAEPAAAPAAAPAAEPAAQAAAGAPAGWYADPSSRFELRYWDGSTWTEHVSRAGQQYTDPPVA